jgi:hypothetical protein
LRAIRGRDAIVVGLAMPAHGAFYRTRPAAIGICLAAVLVSIGAGRRAGMEERITKAAQTIVVDEAKITGRAFLDARAAAIKIRLVAV